MPGVWRAVACCEGVAVIFHSPKACAHVAQTMELNSYYSGWAQGRRQRLRTVPLLCSELTEKDAIFGGTERLQQCIAYAVGHYRPQCLVIANSCVAGIIGDDVEAVVRLAERAYGLPVLTVDCCGFLDAEYYQGYYEIARQLAERFLQPCATTVGTVLLLGDSGGPQGHYAMEVTRLLKLLGISVLGQFPAYMSFKDLPRAASAQAVLILGSRGESDARLRQIARYLQEKLQLPYLDIYPTDWQESQRWLLAVGALLHREEAAAKVLQRERARLQQQVEACLPVTHAKKTVLCIGRQLRYYHPGAILEIIRLLELDLQGIILLDAYTQAERQAMLAAITACTDARVYSAADGEALLGTAEIVLTTHELQNSALKQIFLPMLPRVGTQGAIEMMTAIYRTLCSRIRGGLAYA